jgi:hypothetical protein
VKAAIVDRRVRTVDPGTVAPTAKLQHMQDAPDDLPIAARSAPRRRVEISGSQTDVDNNNPKLSLSDRFSRAAQWDVAAVRAGLHGSKGRGSKSGSR